MPMEESKMLKMASEREEFFSLSPKTEKLTAISIKTFFILQYVNPWLGKLMQNVSFVNH